MSIADYQDPARCPPQRPALAEMAGPTRALHEAVDDAIRRHGVPYLHPRERTVQLDLLGSDAMIAWQEGKVEFAFMQTGCWSELPQVYARYGTETTGALLRWVRETERAPGAILADCGMQATALLFDALIRPRAHVVLMRQIYNKSRKYAEWLCARVGGELSVVDDGDLDALRGAIRPETTLVFAETFTNPLTRALDPVALGAVAQAARAAGSAGLRLAIDTTIATPWSLRAPLLTIPGVDVVLASGTKALAGQDRDLWGYVASTDLDLLNQLMDLQAMRGGILDWRRAEVITRDLPEAERSFRRRCFNAREVAAFLARHPRVERVFHPSLPDHPDRAIIERHYVRHGSLLSLRLRGADERASRRFADALATCVVPRYALSFDGLVTKVNHHPTVSEYFTPPAALRRAGLDRLIRLGVGVEDGSDLIACLNWALWHGQELSDDDLRAWQAARREQLGLAPRA
ncbi:MAG: PLP-dependent transferase [Myxococcales bacterium]|nr:PLP-dependent transferase [Myxococcales bacterium]